MRLHRLVVRGFASRMELDTNELADLPCGYGRIAGPAHRTPLGINLNMAQAQVEVRGDGADTLTGIEKLSFKDVSNVDLGLGSPLPVKDTLTTSSTGAAITRTGSHLIS